MNLIWRYIAAGNLDAANGVESAIYQAFDLLSQMPNAGHLRTDLTDRPLRFWPANPHKKYLIVYNPEVHPIRIVRVLHAALDAKARLLK